MPNSQDPLNVVYDSVVSYDHPLNTDLRITRGTPRLYTFRSRHRDLSLNFTLGWELEANHGPNTVPLGIDEYEDGSVEGEGKEYIVLPSLTRSPKYVLNLLKDLVHRPKLNTDESCGFHVHVSVSNLSLARLRQWAIATEHLALQIEDAAFKAVPDSRKGNTYCKRIVPLKHGDTFDVNKYGNQRRYHWLNTVEMFRPSGIRTIENRLLGHTHRWKYILAWTLFTLELARRGAEMAHAPFDTFNHRQALEDMLIRITKDIKPLSKRAEPIPEWIYNGLKRFGMDESSFGRPLASLTATEAQVRGMSLPSYSDNQPELPNHNDEEDDFCPCGCGTEIRCYTQLHEDGDCDNECVHCHDNGDCTRRCTFCASPSHTTPAMPSQGTTTHRSTSPFVTTATDMMEGTNIVTPSSVRPVEYTAPSSPIAMRYCSSSCQIEHDMYSPCALCNQNWSTHSGHNCHIGVRGSFLSEVE